MRTIFAVHSVLRYIDVVRTNAISDSVSSGADEDDDISDKPILAIIS